MGHWLSRGRRNDEDILSTIRWALCRLSCEEKIKYLYKNFLKSLRKPNITSSVQLGGSLHTLSTSSIGHALAGSSENEQNYTTPSCCGDCSREQNTAPSLCWSDLSVLQHLCQILPSHNLLVLRAGIPLIVCKLRTAIRLSRDEISVKNVRVEQTV